MNSPGQEMRFNLELKDIIFQGWDSPWFVTGGFPRKNSTNREYIKLGVW